MFQVAVGCLSMGFILYISELTVTITPAEVTEDQRVTLTCSTSCPLTLSSNYMWFFNSEPLSWNQAHNKHLVLHAVSQQHAGSYSCAVRTITGLSDRSAEKTLTVFSAVDHSSGPTIAPTWSSHSGTNRWSPTVVQQVPHSATTMEDPPAGDQPGTDLLVPHSGTNRWEEVVAGVSVALLLLILLSVFLWIRRKRTSRYTSRGEASNNTQQLSPDAMYENVSAQSPQQEDHLYSRLLFSHKHTEDVYSTLHTHTAD